MTEDRLIIKQTGGDKDALQEKRTHNNKSRHREVVGHSKNPDEYLRVLRAVEHGWKPDHGSFHESRKKKHGVK